MLRALPGAEAEHESRWKHGHIFIWPRKARFPIYKNSKLCYDKFSTTLEGMGGKR